MDIENNSSQPLFTRGIDTIKKQETSAPIVKKPIEAIASIKETPTEPIVETEKKEVEVKKEVAKETETTDKTTEVIPEENKGGDSEEQEYKPREFSFGDSNVADEKKTETTDAPKETESAITEESVLAFMKTKGIEVDSIEQLSRKETLSEEVLKFKEYQEQTNRGLEDFIQTQRDWKKANPEDTLKEFLKYDQPNFTEEEVADQISLWIVTENDEEELTDSELKAKRLESRKALNKALDFVEKKSKEFATPKTIEPQKQSQEDMVKQFQPYWDDRDKSLQSIGDISLKFGDKDITLSLSQEDKSLLARRTQTVESLYEPYMKKDASDGVPVDTKQLLLNQAWAQESIRNQFISDLAKQIQAITIEDFSKRNRNVTLDGNKKQANAESKSKRGLTIEKANNQSQRNFGQPII